MNTHDTYIESRYDKKRVGKLDEGDFPDFSTPDFGGVSVYDSPVDYGESIDYSGIGTFEPVNQSGDIFGTNYDFTGFSDPTTGDLGTIADPLTTLGNVDYPGASAGDYNDPFNTDYPFYNGGYSDPYDESLALPGSPSGIGRTSSGEFGGSSGGSLGGFFDSLFRGVKSGADAVGAVARAAGSASGGVGAGPGGGGGTSVIITEKGAGATNGGVAGNAPTPAQRAARPVAAAKGGTSMVPIIAFGAIAVLFLFARK